tara:strand:- start:63714 stop:64001 length:288 start_codon:yes stop_codon:yes gene_type:complete
MSKTKEIKRERFTVSEDEIEDFTGSGPWRINGKVYKWVDEILGHSDGELTTVITKRVSDGKHFKFSWLYSYSQNYYYHEDWDEVFPKEVETTIYE